MQPRSFPSGGGWGWIHRHRARGQQSLRRPKGRGLLRSRGTKGKERRERQQHKPESPAAPLSPASRGFRVGAEAGAEEGRVTEPEHCKYINNISLRGGKARNGGSSSSHSDSLWLCLLLGIARLGQAKPRHGPRALPPLAFATHLPAGGIGGRYCQASRPGLPELQPQQPSCLARPLSFSAAVAGTAALLVSFVLLRRQCCCLLLASATFGSPSLYTSSTSRIEASSPSCQIVSSPH